MEMKVPFQIEIPSPSLCGYVLVPFSVALPPLPALSVAFSSTRQAGLVDQTMEKVGRPVLTSGKGDRPILPPKQGDRVALTQDSVERLVEVQQNEFADLVDRCVQQKSRWVLVNQVWGHLRRTGVLEVALWAGALAWGSCLGGSTMPSAVCILSEA